MDFAFPSEAIPAAATFWIAFFLLLHTYIGYPLLMGLLCRARSSSPPDASVPLPSVSIVIAARNEQDRIVARLENLLGSDYPDERLSIILVSDGSTDESARRIAELNSPRIRLIDRESRAGKPACLNMGVAEADSEIIVFADARQRFEPSAIRSLVRHFTNPKVGAVSGALYIESSKSTVGDGVDIYWKLERFIRSSEARWDSCIGCTGAIYAIRRELYDAIPKDTLIDDVEIPMRIATKGARVLYDLEARAYDSQSLEPAKETIRKQRTLAGNYQMLFRHPGWLLPWKNRLWFQLISHKYLRLASPFFLAALLASNLALRNEPFYQSLLMFHGTFYCFALVGALVPSLRSRLFSIPAGFVFLNLMSLRGLGYYLFNDPRAGWESARTTSDERA